LDYVLFTDDKKDIEAKDVMAIYVPNKSLEFEENVIDLANKTYRRRTLEYEFLIDFNTRICELKYDDNGSIQFEIEAFYKAKNDQIYIEYAFDDEIKKLTIDLKEVNL
jgi:hypothetical protein